MEKIKEALEILIAVLAVVIAAAFFLFCVAIFPLAFAFIVRECWNAGVCAAIPAANAVTLWQAFWIGFTALIFGALLFRK